MHDLCDQYVNYFVRKKKTYKENQFPSLLLIDKSWTWQEKAMENK